MLCPAQRAIGFEGLFTAPLAPEREIGGMEAATEGRPGRQPTDLVVVTLLEWEEWNPPGAGN